MVAAFSCRPGSRDGRCLKAASIPEETPCQAALRELKEEIGTDSADILAESRRWSYHDVPDDIGAIMGGRYRGNRQKWFAMLFTGADADINLATAHPEFDAWDWVRPEQLPELIVPFMRQVYLNVLAEFRAFWSPRSEIVAQIVKA